MAGILTSFEDVAKNFNTFKDVINLKAKSAKVNSTTTKDAVGGVIDLSGAVITEIQDSSGATIAPTDGVVKLPASATTIAPSTTSVTDPTA